jgi:hypothetical protein
VPAAPEDGEVSDDAMTGAAHTPIGDPRNIIAASACIYRKFTGGSSFHRLLLIQRINSKTSLNLVGASLFQTPRS